MSSPSRNVIDNNSNFGSEVVRITRHPAKPALTTPIQVQATQSRKASPSGDTVAIITSQADDPSLLELTSVPPFKNTRPPQVYYLTAKVARGSLVALARIAGGTKIRSQRGGSTRRECRSGTGKRQRWTILPRKTLHSCSKQQARRERVQKGEIRHGGQMKDIPQD